MRFFLFAVVALLVHLPGPVLSREAQALRRGIEIQTRIVGGTQASSDNYDYFVEWSAMGCGAALIHEDIAISTAHCFNPKYTDKRVWVGSHWSRDGIPRTIVNITVHPEYKGGVPDDGATQDEAYDFLIMKLDEPVPVLPVEINSNRFYPHDNDLLTVIGFGDLAAGSGRGSWTLQEVVVNHVPDEDCGRIYEDMFESEVMFCAGNTGKDSCQGDSGGPAIDERGVLVGLVSFGTGCGLEGFPGVYSRVNGAIEWIDAQICELSSNPPTRCNRGGRQGLTDIDQAISELAQEASDRGTSYEPGDQGIVAFNEQGIDPFDDQGIVPFDDKGNATLGSTSLNKIRVQIMYGQNPADIAWGIINQQTWEDVHWSDFDEVTQPGLVTTTFQLESGEYWFLIFDRNFDAEDGHVEITDITNGRNDLIWYNDESFFGGSQKVFNVGT